MTAPRLILASGSAIRRRLLANAGFTFEVLPADIEEPLLEDLPPAELAAALALAKARHVSASHPGAVVVGSDQVLVMPDGTVAGKPWDRAAARDQLRALAGRTQTLISAAAIVGDHGEDVVASVVKLTMRPLKAAQLEEVLDWNEWEGNAGSFAYELRGVHLFDDVDGDMFTIQGLPLLALIPVLGARGVGPLASRMSAR